ncbi:MAG: 50S ribosomal protein L25 [Parcubacteria group bacterium]|nr:50S ribosomal protein L25 [Parcubacteria group bacterium]
MELQVQKRDIFGKAVRKLRDQGLIPVELYGHGVENLHLSVAEKEFNRIFKEAGEHTVITVALEGEKRPALIHDVSFDPLSGRVRHVDFYQVRMDEKIRAGIPIIFEGESAAVKDQSGILVKSLQEVEVEALPGDLPHEFKVNLGMLDEIGKCIYVKDIKFGGEVKALIDPETVIATVTAFVPEEEKVPVETPAVEAVKVESEEKVEERRKEKETEGEA